MRGGATVLILKFPAVRRAPVEAAPQILSTMTGAFLSTVAMRSVVRFVTLQWVLVGLFLIDGVNTDAACELAESVVQ